MHWDASWNPGWFWGMHLAGWIFWIVIVVAVWAALTRSARPPSQAPLSPLEILQRRYAEGELTTAEYEGRKARLSESGAAAR
jgi:putative membrane protein